MKANSMQYSFYNYRGGNWYSDVRILRRPQHEADLLYKLVRLVLLGVIIVIRLFRGSYGLL